MAVASQGCLYCSNPADSLEHPLPAAFGEFKGAPALSASICRNCNNTRISVLDQQLARCGPEALFRRLYGIRGRTSHESVNPFYRGSAGGHRLEMKAYDSNLGFDLLMETENGVYRQLRQIVFIEESGKTHHLPIREGISPVQLKAEYDQLCVVQPCRDVRIFYGTEEKDWVHSLIKETWPSVTLGDGAASATAYSGAVGTVGLTDKYFRGIAKIGFHYFLTQFPEYTGHEAMFSSIRRFIAESAGGVDSANEFVGKRETPLLGEMLTPGIRPDGWVAHVLCAESRPGECLAYVQLFLSDDWDAPIYAVRLANDASIANIASAGHLYIYEDGPEGKRAGEASSLLTFRSTLPPAPFKPVVLPPESAQRFPRPETIEKDR